MQSEFFSSNVIAFDGDYVNRIILGENGVSFKPDSLVIELENNEYFNRVNEDGKTILTSALRKIILNKDVNVSHMIWGKFVSTR